jgi:hypothetical protein
MLALPRLVLVLLLCLPAVQAAEERPTPARLTRTEVARIANAAAEIRGYKLRDYSPPRVLYEFTKRDRTWSLYYEGRSQKPGDHFWVSVSDETGLAAVQPRK